MNKLLIAALGAVLFVGVGCQNDGGSGSASTSSDRDTMTVRTEGSSTMGGQDDCSHCAGVQTARADGTCPQCGMKVRTATR